MGIAVDVLGLEVRDVADHVVGGNRFAVAMLAGHSVQDSYSAAFEGGFDDPHQQFASSAAAQLNAFASRPLAGLLLHPIGEISARVFLGFRVGDLLLHGWDLARSIGSNADLDEDLVAEVWNSPQPFRCRWRLGPAISAPDPPAPSPMVLHL